MNIEWLNEKSCHFQKLQVFSRLPFTVIKQFEQAHTLSIESCKPIALSMILDFRSEMAAYLVEAVDCCHELCDCEAWNKITQWPAVYTTFYLIFLLLTCILLPWGKRGEAAVICWLVSLWHWLACLMVVFLKMLWREEYKKVTSITIIKTTIYMTLNNVNLCSVYLWVSQGPLFSPPLDASRIAPSRLPFSAIHLTTEKKR